MAKRKKTKGQTTIYKTIHRKLKIDQWKSGGIRKVTSIEWDSVVDFYYPSASEIWPDERAGHYKIILLYSCIHLSP
jgi:hypothetical protein